MVFLLLAVSVLMAADPAYESASRKLDRIADHKMKPGEPVVFTAGEINAWAHVKVPEAVPQGIREPRVELGMDTAEGSALVDLLKMQQARGKEMNRLIAMMIEGERPLKIYVHVASGGGQCRVDLIRVELGSAVATGPVLDFLIKGFFLPLYPDAKINQPFDLDFDIDRIDIRPSGVRVTMKR